jgi:hypothetical protein
MNKIKTTNWILIIVISIVVLIIAVNIFGKNNTTTKRVDLEGGAYKIEYYDKNGNLVKTENYDKNGTLVTNPFTGIRY